MEIRLIYQGDGGAPGLRHRFYRVGTVYPELEKIIDISRRRAMSGTTGNGDLPFNGSKGALQPVERKLPELLLPVGSHHARAVGKLKNHQHCQIDALAVRL